MDPGGGRVDGDLADGNAHAARALVAQAQDALVVGDDDEANVFARPVAQHLVDAAPVVRRDPEPPRPAEDVAELLAGSPHRRRVDDGQELLQVLAQHVMEEMLVAVLERSQTDVALERIGLAGEVLVDAPRLLLERVDRRGQEPFEAEGPPLLEGEGRALVVQRVAQDLRARGLESGWIAFRGHNPKYAFLTCGLVLSSRVGPDSTTRPFSST